MANAFSPPPQEYTVLAQVDGVLDLVLHVVAVLGGDVGPVQIERHYFFRRKPHRQRGLGAIDARIDERIEFEFDAEFLLGEFFHAADFVLVDGGADCLQLQRQPALPQQADSAHAAVETAGHCGQGLVGFFGAAVEGDLDAEGRILF